MLKKGAVLPSVSLRKVEKGRPPSDSISASSVWETARNGDVSGALRGDAGVSTKENVADGTVTELVVELDSVVVELGAEVEGEVEEVVLGSSVDAAGDDTLVLVDEVVTEEALELSYVEDSVVEVLDWVVEVDSVVDEDSTVVLEVLSTFELVDEVAELDSEVELVV